MLTGKSLQKTKKKFDKHDGECAPSIGTVYRSFWTDCCDERFKVHETDGTLDIPIKRIYKILHRHRKTVRKMGVVTARSLPKTSSCDVF